MLLKVDARQPVRLGIELPGRNGSAVGARSREQRLRVHRRAARRVGAHALEQLLELLGVVGRGEHALQRVAAHAGAHIGLEIVRSGRAQEPFGIGELVGQVLGLDQLDVGLGAAGPDIDRLGAVEIVADRPCGDGVVAGVEPVGREAVLTLGVRDDSHRDG
jgi:hypothetical protein